MGVVHESSMKRIELPLALLMVAFTSCGGGSSGTKPPVGTGGANGNAGAGGTSTAAGGGAGALAGGGAPGSGGGAGTGTTPADASPGNADARTDSPDQAVSNGDVAVGATCPVVNPCGGNLVGTWKASAMCYSMSSTGCRGEVITTDIGQYSIQYNFADDGSYTFTFSGGLKYTSHTPLSCMGSGSEAYQAQVCQSQSTGAPAWPDAGDAGSPPLATSRQCTVDPNGFCVCDEIMSNNSTETGFYTTSGNKLALTVTSLSLAPDAAFGDAGTVQPLDYCVSGDTLLIGVPNTMGSAGSIVLHR
jgi:hypothetical protein